MSKELRQENNEFLLEGNMLPGEQILWQSGTGRFKLLSGANGRSILIKWAITVAVTLASSALMRLPQRSSEATLW